MACEDHNVVLEKLDTICKRLDKTESVTNENVKDIQKLKQHKATNDERFDRVFQILGELKLSIDEIGKSIKEKNDRFPNMVYTVAGMVTGSVLSGVLVWIITK